MKSGTSQFDFLHVRLNTDSCLGKLVPFFIVNTVKCFSALKSGLEQVTLYILYQVGLYSNRAYSSTENAIFGPTNPGRDETSYE